MGDLHVSNISGRFQYNFTTYFRIFVDVRDDCRIVDGTRQEKLSAGRPGKVVHVVQVEANHLVHHPVLLIAVLVIEQSTTTRVPRLELPHDDDALIVSGGQELAIR